MRRWEDFKMLCEYVKMFDRPSVLEEPFVQTLSGKTNLSDGLHHPISPPS